MSPQSFRQSLRRQLTYRNNVRLEGLFAAHTTESIAPAMKCRPEGQSDAKKQPSCPLNSCCSEASRSRDRCRIDALPAGVHPNPVLFAPAPSAVAACRVRFPADELVGRLACFLLEFNVVESAAGNRHALTRSGCSAEQPRNQLPESSIQVLNSSAG